MSTAETKPKKKKREDKPPVDGGLFAFREITESIPASPIGEVNPQEKDLEQQLFGKKGVKEFIDQFERETGIVPKKPDKQTVKYNNRVFSPTNEEDRKLLNELLNDRDRFGITMWKDSWTVHGDYRVFVLYYEILDGVKTDSKLQAPEVPEEDDFPQ